MKKHHVIGGKMDDRMVKKVAANSRIVTCSNGHKNGSTAMVCWVCGQFLQDAKKAEVQKRETPYERVDGTITDPVAEAVRKEINQAIGLPEMPMQAATVNIDLLRMEQLQKDTLLFCHQRKENVPLYTCLNKCITASCMDPDVVAAAQKDVDSRVF